MDFVALAASAAASGANGRRVALAMAAVGGVSALDAYCSRSLAEAEARVPRHDTDTIAVNTPARFRTIHSANSRTTTVQALPSDFRNSAALDRTLSTSLSSDIASPSGQAPAT